MKRLIAISLLLATAPALAADKPTSTPEGTQAATLCYKDCYAAYVAAAQDRIIVPKNDVRDRDFCRHTRNSLVGVMRCADACNELWTAHGSPPLKIRTSLKSDLDREEAAYRAWSCNKDENAPLDNGIEMIH